MIPADVGTRAQAAAEAHLLACSEAMYDEYERGEAASPAIAPYCGCETCIVREVLAAAWPIFEDDVRENGLP